MNIVAENKKKMLKASQYRILTNLGTALERAKCLNRLGLTWRKTTLTRSRKIKKYSASKLT